MIYANHQHHYLTRQKNKTGLVHFNYDNHSFYKLIKYILKLLISSMSDANKLIWISLGMYILLQTEALCVCVCVLTLNNSIN